MKDKLQKVFGDTNRIEDGVATPVKEENCFYTKDKQFQNRQGVGRGGNKFRGRGGRSGVRFDTNAVDQSGNIMRCYNCESIKHLSFDCPPKEHKKQEANMTVHVTLVTGKKDSGTSGMLRETLGKGILDSACTKTVAGLSWIEEYISILPEKDKLDVKTSEKQSKSVFRFGDGAESYGVKSVCLPVNVGSKKLILDVDVVSNDIPLLISKSDMSKMGMSIDFGNHQAKIDNETLKLCCNSAGHYVLPLTEFAKEQCNVVFNLTNVLSGTEGEQEKKAIKLHRQFCHASKEKLVKLLKSSGYNVERFSKVVERVCDACEFCRKYKKPFLKPIVSLPAAEKFNHTVCMDLKELEKGKVWILHMIDAATRYTAACIVYTKKKEVIVSRIFQLWIQYFGAPLKLHSDCGGEFCNSVLEEMNHKLGIETSTTPGEAPFSNAIVERNNAVLYEAMMKTIEDCKCDREIALAWAVSAKNALQNQGGYSPNQMVLGCNVNLPSVVTDMPPALEPSTCSEIVRQNLNALHSARKNFISAESSERIRRALNHKTRTFCEEVYEAGEKVFYKRRQYKGWRGPATVLGKDGNFVLIRQGSSFYRCHPCHLLKVVKSRSDGEFPKMESSVSANDSEKVADSFNSNGKGVINNRNDVISSDSSDNEEVSDTNQQSDTQIEEASDKDDRDMGGNEDVSLLDGVGQSHVEHEENNEPVPSYDIEDGVIDLHNSSKKPKNNSTIRFCLDDGKRGHAKVLSRQPKKTGINSEFINVHVQGEEKPSSINWNKVQWWRPIEEVEYPVFFTEENGCDQNVIDAKQREIENFREHHVFESVEDLGQPTISSKWIFSEKEHDGNKTLKARLVARGFEEVFEDKTDSPTCSRQTLKMMFAVSSTLSWDLHCLDVTAAFLKGEEITRDVFIQPPKEFKEEGKIWKLKRCIYGLNDAPREWYNRVVKELRNLGGKRSTFDNAVFLWHDDQRKLAGKIDMHVDDFIYGGKVSWHSAVINSLVKTFKISKLEKNSFNYIGLNVVQT